MFEQYVSIFVKIERKLGDITSPWWNKHPSMGIEWGYESEVKYGDMVICDDITRGSTNNQSGT